MEKGFKNITNLSNRVQSERMKQIELKLQKIPDERGSYAKDERITGSNAKINNVERESIEVIKRVENKRILFDI
jgi:hypothetical protein